MSRSRTVTLLYSKVSKSIQETKDKTDQQLAAAYQDMTNKIVNIFSKGSMDEKGRVMSILTECDPSNSGKYEKILDQKIF